MTRTNLSSGVRRLVLCKPTVAATRTPSRWCSAALPQAPRPLTVVAWVGDNILDFPGMSQAARQDPAMLAPFGSRWFILPNPMYGSWERNVEQ